MHVREGVESPNDEAPVESARRQRTRERLVETYLERSGLTLPEAGWRFYEVFGLFRLAVIAQQIWYRYVHRQTTNEAYAVFGPAVGYLETRCRGLLAGGTS